MKEVAEPVGEPSQRRWSRTGIIFSMAFIAMAFLQFVFIHSGEAERIRPEVYLMVGAALLILVLLMSLVMVLVYLFLFLIGRVTGLHVLAIFSGVGVLMLWMYAMMPQLIDRSDTLSHQHHEENADENKEQAYETLQELYDVANTYQAAAHKDSDSDSIGEFGTLSELATAGLLPSRLQRVAGEKTYHADGYVYMIYIPEDTNLAEQKWCAYTWPELNGNTGFGTMFIHETGERYYRVAENFGGLRLQDGAPSYDAYLLEQPAGHGIDMEEMKNSTFRNAINTTRWEAME